MYIIHHRRVDASGVLRSRKVMIKSNTMPRWAEKVYRIHTTYDIFVLSQFHGCS